MPQPLPIDKDYLLATLRDLLSIPSPTGYTDEAVRYVCGQLEKLKVPFEMTRRGAIRANLSGRQYSPDRAIVAHVDTLGAQVKALKENGRLAVVPIGHWSSRFAEGARCTVFSDTARFRGTILPLKASGHTYGDEIDEQPTSWQHVELRVDDRADDRAGLEMLGINVGDIIAIDPQPEFMDTGYLVSRHLDDKAGAATVLAAVEAVVASGVSLPVDCHILFTISEEVGSGASNVLHQDVVEMVTVDNGTPAPGQNSRETGVTISMADSTGPFDYALTHSLLRLCREHGIDHQRDVFRHYRCDSAAAIEAGNDIRTALLCFGVDASHGYERTHINALECLGRLLTAYMQSDPEGPLKLRSKRGT